MKKIASRMLAVLYKCRAGDPPTADKSSRGGQGALFGIYGKSQIVAKATGPAAAGSRDCGNACGILERNKVPQASSLRKRIARPLYEWSRDCGNACGSLMGNMPLMPEASNGYSKKCIEQFKF